MTWPLSQDYNEAIQNPVLCFSDPELKQGEAVCNALGLPIPCSGNFADVYAVTTPQGKWAVKCFTRQIPGIRERYVAISKYLHQWQLPFMVEFKFLDQGIKIKNQWYPILKMHWVEGFALNQFVKNNVDKTPVLGALCQIWQKVAIRLREVNLAHADLQHGNVLLVPGAKAGMLSVRLVDYDGMCVPSLEMLKSIEVGHPNFQHPQRLKEGIYSLDVDRFSHLVIYTALRGLMVGGPGLWQKYDNGDNLLFKQTDFEAPNKSQVFSDLFRLNDPEVRKLAGALMDATKKPLQQTPLLEDLGGKPPGNTGMGRKTAAVADEATAGHFSDLGGEGSAAPRIPRKKKSRFGCVLAASVILVTAGIGGFWFLDQQRARSTGAHASPAPDTNTVVALTPTGPKQPATTKMPPTETKPETAKAPTTKVEPKPEPKPELKPEPKPELKSEPKNIATLQGHTSDVYSVAFSPDGKTLASRSGDKTIKLWDMASGKNTTTLQGIGSVAFSPDSKTLASASGDKTIRLWDVASGKNTTTLQGHTDFVGSAAFSPDGKTLASASGGGDKTIKLWDVASGKNTTTLQGDTEFVGSVAFSPDGKTLALASRVPWTIKLWDVASGKNTASLAGHSGGFSCVAFSPDGKSLVSGSHDKTVKLWDVGTGTNTATLQGHTHYVFSVAFSPDGKTIASGSHDKTVKLWDVGTGTNTATLQEHTWVVWSVAFSPDGKTLASASGDKTIKLWDISDSVTKADVAKPDIKPETKPETKPEPKPEPRDTVTIGGNTVGNSSVAFSPDGKTLASGSRRDAMVKLWAVASGKITATLGRHTGAVRSVAFSPDSTTLASGSLDKTIKLWDVGSGKNIATLQGHTNAVMSVAFSPDGKTLASGSTDKTIILWDVTTGKERVTLKGHTAYVYSVAFSPDGKTLASGSGGYNRKPWGEVKLWEIASGKNIATLQGLIDAVQSVAFSPDGKTLASGSGGYNQRPWPGELKLWEIASGKNTATLQGHTDEISSVAFRPDGKVLASGSLDKTIKLWEVSSGKNTTTLRGHTDEVSSVAYSPDGKTLASGSQDQTVKLWDIPDSVTKADVAKPEMKPVTKPETKPEPKPEPKSTATLQGHTAPVHSVAFSRDGKTLASGSSDRGRVEE